MNEIDELLLIHQITPGYLGYKYIKWLLENVTEDIANLSLEIIYNKIANIFESTRGGVERSIRNAIHHSDLKNLSNKNALAFLQLQYRTGIFPNLSTNAKTNSTLEDRLDSISRTLEKILNRLNMIIDTKVDEDYGE